MHIFFVRKLNWKSVRNEKKLFPGHPFINQLVIHYAPTGLVPPHSLWTRRCSSESSPLAQWLDGESGGRFFLSIFLQLQRTNMRVFQTPESAWWSLSGCTRSSSRAPRSTAPWGPPTFPTVVARTSLLFLVPYPGIFLVCISMHDIRRFFEGDKKIEIQSRLVSPAHPHLYSWADNCLVVIPRKI